MKELVQLFTHLNFIYLKPQAFKYGIKSNIINTYIYMHTQYKLLFVSSVMIIILLLFLNTELTLIQAQDQNNKK